VFGSIDHVGVAVVDLDAAIALHRDTYGMSLVHRETIESLGVEAALLGVGDRHIELLAPLGNDTPVGRFLDRRGPGLHHVAYRVDDVAAALADLRAAGLQAIDEAPRTGIRGSSVAFLHPSASGGVLIELVQLGGRSPVNGAMDGADRNQGAGRTKARGAPSV
jgi:methylmalonyl-CoA/ethylmalonyl-CoA epimerase